MKENIAIAVHNLKKNYKDKEVLKGVDFEIEKGCIFCLLGSNGSGKTTTVKILSTLLQMDGGNARINGWDVNTQGSEVRKSISLTGQFAAVDEIMTGRENLELIARLCHIKNYKKRAQELLNDFQLEEAANKRCATYSGGMRRRLDIAMCLVGNPSVIFLDEPTTGLDPQSRIAMWNIIQELKQNGSTIFLTTQYLEEAERLADHIAILHDGKIIADGTVADIKKLSSKDYITFHLSDLEKLTACVALFSDKVTTMDEGTLTFTIEVDGSMKQATEIFVRLKESNIEVHSFNQKNASLEDVFLQLVDNREGASI